MTEQFTKEQRDESFYRVLSTFEHLKQEAPEEVTTFLKEQMSLYTALEEYELTADIRDLHADFVREFCIPSMRY
jgi:hypothetical protein